MERLRRFLEKQKLTQMEFAEMMGVSQATVSDWLRGASHPKIGKLRKMSTLTKLSIDKLLEVA
jgi:transcriptional regulator with XRE-family HTH domain